MLEKDREARRNDSGLTQNKFVDILFALNPCVFIKKAGVAAFNLFTVNSGVIKFIFCTWKTVFLLFQNINELYM